MAIKTNPQKIEGSWLEGYALDRHTLSSEYIGDNEFGHPQFNTTRSEIGELLFKLKYRSDQAVISQLAGAAATFVNKWKPDVDLLIPVPPSRVRAKQPVFVVGAEIAKLIQISFSSELVTRRDALPELKNVSRDERTRLLKGAHDVQKGSLRGRKVLLFDDLFQSGSTMNAICGRPALILRTTASLRRRPLLAACAPRGAVDATGQGAKAHIPQRPGPLPDGTLRLPVERRTRWA